MSADAHALLDEIQRRAVPAGAARRFGPGDFRNVTEVPAKSLDGLLATLREMLTDQAARRIVGCSLVEELCDCALADCAHGKQMYCDQHDELAAQCWAFIRARSELANTVQFHLGGGR